MKGGRADETPSSGNKISEDCIVFKDETWDKLMILAGIIKTYAALAGGTGTSSYYQACWNGSASTMMRRTSLHQIR